MIKYNIFPTLLTEFSEVISPSECSDIVSRLDKKFFVPHQTIDGVSLSTHTLFKNILDHFPKEYGDRLKSIIKNSLDAYAKEYGLFEIEMGNCWINIQQKDSILKYHTHPGSVVSGALYLNVDKNSSPLFFYNHNPFNSYMNTTRSSAYTCNMTGVEPKIGTLYLFPSWLGHGSNNIKNQTKDRTVLSFNSLYV
jgi:uncharacterized protein (TIGR02466 family)